MSSFSVDPTKPTLSSWNQKLDESKTDPTYYVSIRTESGEHADGTLVCIQLPRHQLLSSVPALHKFIFPFPNGDILLPGREHGVDDEILHNVMQAVLAMKGQEGFQLEVEEDPIAYIKVHVILTLLELEKVAMILQERIWELFERYELKFEYVNWIWETFGSKLEARHAPDWPAGTHVLPFTDFYVEAMAWQILNMRAIQKLDAFVDEYVFGNAPMSQPALKRVVEEREKRFGLAKGYDPQSVTTQVSAQHNPYTNLRLIAAAPPTPQRRQAALNMGRANSGLPGWNADSDGSPRAKMTPAKEEGPLPTPEPPAKPNPFAQLSASAGFFGQPSANTNTNTNTASPLTAPWMAPASLVGPSTVPNTIFGPFESTVPDTTFGSFGQATANQPSTSSDDATMFGGPQMASASFTGSGAFGTTSQDIDTSSSAPPAFGSSPALSGMGQSRWAPTAGAIGENMFAFEGNNGSASGNVGEGAASRGRKVRQPKGRLHRH